MASIAIVVGNTDYSHLSKLECCRDDQLAIKQLLDATEKYAEIEIIENAEANDLKSRIRDAVDKAQSWDELFFYYTGHGYQHETEFFFCASNFDSRRPNETGLSTNELHTLLKLADAQLVVKVIDACNSGTLLVKADGGLMPSHKHGFKNLIQISSCLDSQNSLTGDPLSLFTEKFRAAALRKTEGVVYYTDIINTLRDEFLENNSQTPFFVSQYTGREQFVDDALRLSALRNALTDVTADRDNQVQIVEQQIPSTRTLLDMLVTAETKMAKPDGVQKFVGTFFDNLTKKLSTTEFADFFDFVFTEHAGFIEPTTRGFIIRVLSNEKRPDNFVTATITRKSKKRSAWEVAGLTGSLMNWLADDDLNSEYVLELNCAMQRTQLRVTLTPKYVSLKRIVLVVTCAPSLEHCYIFEIGTQHLLSDFGKFDAEGSEIVRRWYKLGWDDSTEGLVSKISNKLGEIVREYLEAAAKRLAEQ